MIHDKWSLGGGLLLVLILGSAGCATRGYVRDRITDLNQQMSQKNDELSNDIQSVKGSAATAQARADEAATGADLAHRLALGNEGFREASRFRVFFDFDRADLTDASCATLDQATDQILKNPQYLIEVCGFTDSVGSDAYNLQLGERRAEAVRRYLVDKDPAELNRFQSISFGKTPPVSEVSGLGDGAQRRQVAVVLVERTEDTTPPPVSQNSSGPGDRDSRERPNRSANPDTLARPNRTWNLEQRPEPSEQSK